MDTARPLMLAMTAPIDLVDLVKEKKTTLTKLAKRLKKEED